ncbi:major facilitator superfamily domain-containing protein [Geopyxis carbonaria]|nr:major facilitator superfamily domain-containing protein [Geopyxis carbonaria]
MNALRRLSHELSLPTLLHAPRDIHLLLLTRFLRMSAYGATSLILAVFLTTLGTSDLRIGLFMTLTLLGDVALSLLLTLCADSLGRRRILLLGSLAMACSGVVFGTPSNYYILLAAAVLGVISPSGNEIGPFRAVEESTLAGLVAEGDRTAVFAWYVFAGTLGMSGGLAACGWMVDALQRGGWEEQAALRAGFGAYAGIGMVKAGLTLLLSPACEAGADAAEDSHPLNSHASAAPPPAKPGFTQLSSATRWTLLQLCSLFAIDSLASGMVPYSLINYYLFTKFRLAASTLGAIVATTFFLSALSNLSSAALARRIGLVRTMVYTHLPSAVFLALVPAPRGLWPTVALLVARGALSSMDQAPRSAFLAAVVKPGERTAVMGVVNVVKTLSQSGGPTVTGVLAGEGRFWAAFVAAGALKAGYDLGLLAVWGRKRQEEQEQKQGQ